MNHLFLFRHLLSTLVLFVALWTPSLEAQELSEEKEFQSKSRLLTQPLRLPEWILRTAFFPLQKLVEWNEEYYLAERAVDFFSNEKKSIFIYPTLLVDTNDGFAVGVQNLNKGIIGKTDRLTLGGDIHENGDSEVRLTYSGRKFNDWLYSLHWQTSYEDDSNERFFGLGPESSSLNESIYEIRTFYSRIMSEFTPFSQRWRFGLGLDYHRYKTASGNDDDDREKLEDVFQISDLVAFGESTEYLSPLVSFTYDSRPERAHPTKGQVAKVWYQQHEALDNQGESFSEGAVELVQIFEIEERRRSIAVRGHYRRVYDGENSPFYLLPMLDQRTPLRGYRNGRFTDQRYLVGNLEYRYKIWQNLEANDLYALGTLFLDAGQVYSQTSELNSDNTEFGGGLGFSVGVSTHTLYRMQLAVGGEGLEFIFGLNQAF